MSTFRDFMIRRSFSTEVTKRDNRDDWSGAYLLGGYTFQYYYDGSYDLDRLQLLGPGLTDGAKLELSQRFDVFSVRANTAKYTYIFEKVSENTYTIRSYWTGKYLAFSSMQLIMANAPIRVTPSGMVTSFMP